MRGAACLHPSVWHADGLGEAPCRQLWQRLQHVLLAEGPGQANSAGLQPGAEHALGYTAFHVQPLRPVWPLWHGRGGEGVE